MSKANKTQETDSSVKTFLDKIPDETRKKDCYTVLELMKKITGKEPKMWGSSIVGFGNYRYKYESGREGDWFLTGFSPRKQNLTLYIMPGFQGYGDLMKKLGKYKSAVSCLYINRLGDIDLQVLKEVIESSVERMKKMKVN
jgi:hypothetical protein